MSDTYKFECDRCGLCCERTVVKTELGRYGAFLIPHERFLFPEKCVRPLFGIGIKGKSRPRPKIIYAYQNISQPCVWYVPELKACMIYDRRPLSCMEFPLSAWHGGVMIHRECPQIAKLVPEGSSLRSNQLLGLDVEKQAFRKMQLYFTSVFILNIHNVDLEYCWAYELTKNKWVQWTLDQLVRFTEKVNDKVKAI